MSFSLSLSLCLTLSLYLSFSLSLSLSLFLTIFLSYFPSLSYPLSVLFSLYYLCLHFSQTHTLASSYNNYHNNAFFPFSNRRLLDLLAARANSADARHQLIRMKKGLKPDDFKSDPLKLFFPPPALCTDNGVMVAWAGIEKIKLGISDSIDGQVSNIDMAAAALEVVIITKITLVSVLKVVVIAIISVVVVVTLVTVVVLVAMMI